MRWHLVDWADVDVASVVVLIVHVVHDGTEGVLADVLEGPGEQQRLCHMVQ